MIKKEFAAFLDIFKRLNKKVVLIFTAVAVLQTVSWYITSRRFFRINLYDYFLDAADPNLYAFLYWFFSDCITLCIIPLLIIKFVLKEKITSYGLKAGDYKTGVSFSILVLVPVIIAVWFITGIPEFGDYYPMLKSSRESWLVFIIFELSLFVYMFAWEFFWRGFMLFGLEEEFGYYSIFLQMVPFVILHNGKPMLETFGAIAGGILLGYLALRTRSFLYGVFIHYIMMFCVDLFSILRFRTNDFSNNLVFLFNSILK